MPAQHSIKLVPWDDREFVQAYERVAADLATAGIRLDQPNAPVEIQRRLRADGLPERDLLLRANGRERPGPARSLRRQPGRRGAGSPEDLSESAPRFDRSDPCMPRSRIERRGIRIDESAGDGSTIRSAAFQARPWSDR